MLFFPSVFPWHDSRILSRRLTLRLTGLFLGMASFAAPANAQVTPTTQPATTGLRASTTNAAAAPAQASPTYGPQRPAQANAAPAAQAQVPRFAVDPFQLNAVEKQRLFAVLGFWEEHSSGVKTYSCDFVRRDYNSTFGPKDHKTPFTISEGIIRYASPDKGEFKVETIATYKPGANGAPMFPKVKSEHDEHWICDGDSVFELNGKTKQLIEEKLPPEMKGNAIVDGPLPFMFGAKREKLMARYWLKELEVPADRKGEYWFDARPKTREDAANFQRIMVVLDEKVFLPTAMQIYPPGWDGRTNWTRQSYVFNNRKKNDPLQRNQNWLGRFISPRTPRGWKRVVNNFAEPENVPPNPMRVANPNPGAGPRNGQNSAQAPR